MWCRNYEAYWTKKTEAINRCLASLHHTICHSPAFAHFFLLLHKRLNVVFAGKPIISLSSCILNVNVDSCVPTKYLKVK